MDINIDYNRVKMRYDETTHIVHIDYLDLVQLSNNPLLDKLNDTTRFMLKNYTVYIRSPKTNRTRAFRWFSTDPDDNIYIFKENSGGIHQMMRDRLERQSLYIHC